MYIMCIDLVVYNVVKLYTLKKHLHCTSWYYFMRSLYKFISQYFQPIIKLLFTFFIHKK